VPLMDGHMLLIVLIVACGSGIFLRLVAKEKRRREKHLELRLQEKIKELAEGGRLRQAEDELKRKRGEAACPDGTAEDSNDTAADPESGD